MSDNERVRVYDIGVDAQTIDDPAMAHTMPVTYRTGDIISPYIPFQEPLLLQDEHFIDCVRTGSAPRTSGQRGLDIVRVLAATDDMRYQDRPEFLHGAESFAGRTEATVPGVVTHPSRHPPLAATPSIAS
jgi:hypothetical protein